MFQNRQGTMTCWYSFTFFPHTLSSTRSPRLFVLELGDYSWSKSQHGTFGNLLCMVVDRDDSIGICCLMSQETRRTKLEKEPTRVALPIFSLHFSVPSSIIGDLKSMQDSL